MRSVSVSLRRYLRKCPFLWSFLKILRNLFLNVRRALFRKRWQRLEQAFRTFLDSFPGERSDFFFVQIGANDGAMADPLREHIVRHKWKGILVEPLKGKFAQLLQNYAHTEGLIFENAAISKAPGPGTLFRVKEGHAIEPWQEGLATFCPEKNALRNLPEGRIDQESVDCITLMDLLKKHHIEKLDLLQIDVEGYDFEIIKLIDFSAIEPVLINYEHCNLRSSERRQARSYLRKRGYVLIQREYDTSAVLPRYADRLLGRSSVGL